MYEWTAKYEKFDGACKVVVELAEDWDCKWFASVSMQGYEVDGTGKYCETREEAERWGEGLAKALMDTVRKYNG